MFLINGYRKVRGARRERERAARDQSEQKPVELKLRAAESDIAVLRPGASFAISSAGREERVFALDAEMSERQ